MRLSLVGGQNNQQHNFEANLRYLRFWLYWESGTTILATTEAPTVRLAFKVLCSLVGEGGKTGETGSPHLCHGNLLVFNRKSQGPYWMTDFRARDSESGFYIRCCMLLLHTLPGCRGPYDGLLRVRPSSIGCDCVNEVLFHNHSSCYIFHVPPCNDGCQVPQQQPRLGPVVERLKLPALT